MSGTNREAVAQNAAQQTLIHQRNEAMNQVVELNTRLTLAMSDLQETQALLASTQTDLDAAKAEIESLRVVPPPAANDAHDALPVPDALPG